MTSNTKTTAGAKPGPPLKKIDWRAVGEAAKIFCTQEELAAIAGVCVETLETACKRELDIEFSDWIDQKRVVGKASLRRKQFQTAMAGNVTMLIWLGKQWLAQKDKAELSANDTRPIYFLSNLPGLRKQEVVITKEVGAK